MPQFINTKVQLGLCIASIFSLPLIAPQGTSTPDPLLTPEQREILSHISIVYEDDGQGGSLKTIRLEGANFQIVNGSGQTDSVNGVGNLIVGYNEFRVGTNDRTGSHNIVGGKMSNYTSFGGLVSGLNNTISGTYASVPAGAFSTAAGSSSSVVGGHSNRADGNNACVSGGKNNNAAGQYSAITGGGQSEATGIYSVVLAGTNNEASNENSVVVGGAGNKADGRESAILGGRANVTAARWTSIGGGHETTVDQGYWSAVGPVTFVD